MSDIQKEKFINFVKDLLDFDKDHSEEYQDNLVSEIDKIAPDPEWLDYVFHSEEFVINADAFEFNYIGLADKVFSYKPIIL